MDFDGARLRMIQLDRAISIATEPDRERLIVERRALCQRIVDAAKVVKA
jgi:hypothetical protein